MKRILILFALVLFPSLAYAQIDADRLRHKKELDALTGLKDFSVVVSIGPDHGSGFNLSEEDIKRAIVARCRDKGAPVTSPSSLIFSASIRLKRDSRVKGYAVALSVEAWQVLLVDRTDTLERVVFWERSEVLVNDSSGEDLRGALAGMVDEFVSDWLVSNPGTYRR